jgi:hypothetical protein
MHFGMKQVAAVEGVDEDDSVIAVSVSLVAVLTMEVG